MRPISAKRLRSWRRAWIGCVNYNFRSRTLSLPLCWSLSLFLPLSLTFPLCPSRLLAVALRPFFVFIYAFVFLAAFVTLRISLKVGVRVRVWCVCLCVCESVNIYVCVWLCVVVTPAIILSWCGVKCCCCCCCTRIDELTAVRAILASLPPSLSFYTLYRSVAPSLSLSLSLLVFANNCWPASSAR